MNECSRNVRMQYTHILNGRYAGWYPDGRKKYEATYVNGKREGLAITYYPNGKLAGQVIYRNDLRHGEYLKWHTNGILAKQVRYVYGKREGVCRFWNLDGGRLADKFYVEDEAVLPTATTS